MPSDLAAKILTLNHEAVEQGQYAAAYHLLCAALDLQPYESSVIDEVLVRAEQQGALVDAVPDHPLSQARSQRRGHSSVFRSLCMTARAKRARLSAEEVIAEHAGPPSEA